MLTPAQVARPEHEAHEDEDDGEVLPVLPQRGLDAGQPFDHRTPHPGGLLARRRVQQPASLLEGFGQLRLPSRRPAVVPVPPYLADHRPPAARPPRPRMMPARGRLDHRAVRGRG
ncbi:hypothetical protein AQJ11_24430 [Streptomyces corchorusii]|uniref:Uncharacterized protein n=1 Tax=Streptomyces corchorusii TaxID=1903 RepID=A0A101Q494_STRCK|nr:hypothetical protein AQJ11_24430 [Streptomyces corchorusii]